MKEDKNKKNSGHSVETPAPPQVMDPSVPPHKQGYKKGKENARQKKEDDTKQQPLAPREEL
jgi:hypothetical protein